MGRLPQPINLKNGIILAGFDPLLLKKPKTKEAATQVK